MTSEASEVASSAPPPPSSPIATGTEASVPGVAPLGATGVLGRDVVEASDEAGDIGGRGIGENGGAALLGTDANESTPPSAETAIPETDVDHARTDEAGGGGVALWVGLLCWPLQTLPTGQHSEPSNPPRGGPTSDFSSVAGVNTEAWPRL
ncbi:unnamed protein product [Phytophthora fragariaefolia]|uniref:Unnamed protein product n=1 Tax=Phytophthora fragariaefolia TaxID=1490495 RepID=A0A9W7CTC3_9STRA|nr:unnamed protein product [Phytophthora fragariaefolia]